MRDIHIKLKIKFKNYRTTMKNKFETLLYRMIFINKCLCKVLMV